MKVLYITNIPSPYKVDFYNELGKYCELTALFETDASTERSEEWKKYCFDTFEGIILKGRRMSADTAFCPEIVKHLQKGLYDIVVLTVLASPTALSAAYTLAISLCTLMVSTGLSFTSDNMLFRLPMAASLLSMTRLTFAI